MALTDAMLIQVVHCHPLDDSFSHSLYRDVVKTLRRRGHDVVATDPYREGFDPIDDRGRAAQLHGQRL